MGDFFFSPCRLWMDVKTLMFKSRTKRKHCHGLYIKMDAPSGCTDTRWQRRFPKYSRRPSLSAVCSQSVDELCQKELLEIKPVTAWRKLKKEKTVEYLTSAFENYRGSV